MADLTRRELAIVRLLETSNAGLPEASPQSAVASGFKHKERSRACPDCLANEKISPTCETCFGRGHIDPVYAKNVASTDALPDDRDRRDPYSVNDKTVRYGLDGSRHDAAHARDRQIDELGRQTRTPRSEAELLAEANEHPYGWERERELLRKRFDHDAVDLALEQLRMRDPVAYRALNAVFVYRWLAPRMKQDALRALEATPGAYLVAVGGIAEQSCRRGLRFLSARLAVVELARGRWLRAPEVAPPAVNLVARGRHDDRRALAQRDAEIRRRHQAGASIEQLETEFGLKKSALYEAINGRAA